MIKVTITVENEHGQESSETYTNNYDKVYNNEWDEIVKGLLDEAVSTKEF